jgi:hypothetical protein
MEFIFSQPLGLQGAAGIAIELERGPIRRFAFLLIGDFR